MNNHNCWNCKYGRRACAPNKVACAYVFSNHQMDYQKTLNDLDLDTISTGWGYMKRAVDDEEGNSIGSGMMTNGVVIFDKDYCCKYYECNKKTP